MLGATQSMSPGAVTTQPPFFVTQSKERIIGALYDYYLMDAEQICRRIYSSPKSISKARKNITELRRNGFIDWTFVSNHSRHGSDHAVYRLTSKSLDYLKDLGYDVADRYPR